MKIVKLLALMAFASNATSGPILIPRQEFVCKSVITVKRGTKPTAIVGLVMMDINL
jgi:hypothetical protein